MDSLKQFESTVEGWLKPLPHLPSIWRKWLGENIWWLTIIGVVLEAFAAMELYHISTASDPISRFVSQYGLSTDGWTNSVMMSMTLIVLTGVLMALAVSPLKEYKKRGWDLLFLTVIVSVSSDLVVSIIDFNLVRLIPSLISAAISFFVGMYLLFEIRSHFNTATVIDKSK
jgi:uncharacterized membrane protein YhaH (DUF805 family)